MARAEGAQGRLVGGESERGQACGLGACWEGSGKPLGCRVQGNTEISLVRNVWREAGWL